MKLSYLSVFCCLFVLLNAATVSAVIDHNCYFNSNLTNLTRDTVWLDFGGGERFIKEKYGLDVNLENISTGGFDIFHFKENLPLKLGNITLDVGYEFVKVAEFSGFFEGKEYFVNVTAVCLASDDPIYFYNYVESSNHVVELTFSSSFENASKTYYPDISPLGYSMCNSSVFEEKYIGDYGTSPLEKEHVSTFYPVKNIPYVFYNVLDGDEVVTYYQNCFTQKVSKDIVETLPELCVKLGFRSCINFWKNGTRISKGIIQENDTILASFVLPFFNVTSDFDCGEYDYYLSFNLPPSFVGENIDPVAIIEGYGVNVTNYTIWDPEIRGYKRTDSVFGALMKNSNSVQTTSSKNMPLYRFEVIAPVEKLLEIYDDIGSFTRIDETYMTRWPPYGGGDPLSGGSRSSLQLSPSFPEYATNTFSYLSCDSVKLTGTSMGGQEVSVNGTENVKSDVENSSVNTTGGSLGVVSESKIQLFSWYIVLGFFALLGGLFLVRIYVRKKMVKR